jgi:hypothetical protein
LQLLPKTIKRDALEREILKDLTDKQTRALIESLYRQGGPSKDIPYKTAMQVLGKEAIVNDKIELSYGRNKIEVSCTNTKQVESYRDSLYADYYEPIQPNLYYIGFRVSEYNNKNLIIEGILDNMKRHTGDPSSWSGCCSMPASI